MWWGIGMVVYTILGNFCVMVNAMHGLAEEDFKRLGASALAWMLWAVGVVVMVMVRR